jgi:hypothetical protein
MSLSFPVNTAAKCPWTDCCILGELKEEEDEEFREIL